MNGERDRKHWPYATAVRMLTTWQVGSSLCRRDVKGERVLLSSPRPMLDYRDDKD